MDNLGLSIWQAQECMAFTYSRQGAGGGGGWGSITRRMSKGSS